MKESYRTEYKRLFNEPEASTKWKSALYGLSEDAWIYLTIECHVLEALAKAGLLDGPGWFLRLSKIYTEARQIDGFSHKVNGEWIN